MMSSKFIELTRSWLEATPSRSVPSLAKRSGVSPSTIRRVISNEQNPSESTARSILRIVADPQQYVDVVSEMFPDHRNVLPTFFNSIQAQKLDTNTTMPFDDTLGFEIFCATSNKHGYSQKSLVKELGSKGEARIEEYLASGQLRLEDGKLYSDEVLFSSPDSLLKLCEQAPKLLRNYLALNKCIYFNVDTYSEAEIEDIADAARDFVARVSDITAKSVRPSNGKPTYISLNFGSLNSDKEMHS